MYVLMHFYVALKIVNKPPPRVLYAEGVCEHLKILFSPLIMVVVKLACKQEPQAKLFE